MRLSVGDQHSEFWLILARFVDYYSPFWCPGQNSTINEPRGAFTCRSSALAVLADSGQFRGLLLTVLGSRSDFHSRSTPRCAYMSVVNTRSFADSDPFRGLLLTVLWSQSDFHGCRTPRCAYVLVVKSRSFGRFWPVSWTITH